MTTTPARVHRRGLPRPVDLRHALRRATDEARPVDARLAAWADAGRIARALGADLEEVARAWRSSRW